MSASRCTENVENVKRSMFDKSRITFHQKRIPSRISTKAFEVEIKITMALEREEKDSIKSLARYNDKAFKDSS